VTVKNALSAGYSGGRAIVGFDVARALSAALLKAAMSLGRSTCRSVIRPSLCTLKVMTTCPFRDIAA